MSQSGGQQHIWLKYKYLMSSSSVTWDVQGWTWMVKTFLSITRMHPGDQWMSWASQKVWHPLSSTITPLFLNYQNLIQKRASAACFWSCDQTMFNGRKDSDAVLFVEVAQRLTDVRYHALHSRTDSSPTRYKSPFTPPSPPYPLTPSTRFITDRK